MLTSLIILLINAVVKYKYQTHPIWISNNIAQINFGYSEEQNPLQLRTDNEYCLSNYDWLLEINVKKKTVHVTQFETDDFNDLCKYTRHLSEFPIKKQLALLKFLIKN